MTTGWRQRRFSWTTLGGLLLTAALLGFALRHLDAAALGHALGRTRFPWIGLAFAAYGGAVAAAAWRWHIALVCVDQAVHWLASGRAGLAGHFLFTALFGVVGGDAAKSAFYARWFRLKLPEVLAAAPLDRLTSLAALLVLTVAAAFFMFSPHFVQGFRGEFPFATSPRGLLIMLNAVGVILAVIWLWRPAGETWWKRVQRALHDGALRFARNPALWSRGFLAALTAQVLLSAVLALSLRAVSSTPVPWAECAWTFPIVVTISSLPFTFAGAGARELALIALLKPYGVPAADCVAAALFTLLGKCAWATLGAGALWREHRAQSAAGNPPLPATISVVIPTLNEEGELPETLRRLRAIPEVTEIIVVDGGSTDDTRRIAERLRCTVLTAPPGRGGQLRAGAAAAQGDIILLLHADTWLPPHAGRALLACLRDATVVAGGFWKKLRAAPWLTRGSRFRCGIRMLLARRVLGDQALFMRQSALAAIGGVPPVPLMEEFELCRRLRAVGRLTLAGAVVETSARKFDRLGVLRTYWLMAKVTWSYWRGVPPDELARMYRSE